jgi:hypothetical protein
LVGGFVGIQKRFVPPKPSINGILLAQRNYGHSITSLHARTIGSNSLKMGTGNIKLF